MLISFEGQDGAGKTALLTRVHNALWRRNIASVVVREFSDSPYGRRLLEAVAQDKFLRPLPGEATTAMTRALEIVADLYYQDEREIGPALQHGAVVLKDRHLDTIFYTLTPTLTSLGAIKDAEQALTWLHGLCSQLRYRPNLTIYADAPLSVRMRRIAQRKRSLREERGEAVSAEDARVFAARELIAGRLITEQPSRFLVVDNGHRPLLEGVREIVEAIEARRNTASREGER